MKTVQLLKLLLIYYSKIFGNFMVFFYHLHWIKTRNLFQQSRKTFARFWILKIIYPQHLTQKYIDKVKQPIKKSKNILILLSTINKMISQKNQQQQNLQLIIINHLLESFFYFLPPKAYIPVLALIQQIFPMPTLASGFINKKLQIFSERQKLSRSLHKKSQHQHKKVSQSK